MKKILFLFASLLMLSCSSDDTDTVVDDPVEENPVEETPDPSECIYRGDVRLFGQAQVDAFGAKKYCKITANLTITGSVTSLEKLSALKAIGGELRINGTSLVSLNGLQGIKQLSAFYLEDNIMLKNFSGLDNLEIVERFFVISNNGLLESFEGLGHLTYSSRLEVNKNYRLKNFTGLISLTGLYQLYLDDIGITTFTGLEGVTSISGTIKIANCNLLTSIEALRNISTVEQIEIVNASSLRSLKGLERLANNLISLKITNAGITTLEGLENVPSINSIEIKDTGLTSLEKLESLTGLGYLSIENDEALTSLAGLEDVKFMGILSLINCPNITSLQPLNLTDVGSYLYQGNSAVAVININNTGITSLAGINKIHGSIQPVYCTIKIINNPDLYDLCGISGFFPFDSSIPSTVSISGNGYNPTEQDIIAGNCAH